MTIGTRTAITAGSISCTLPSTLLTSGLYRFRVVSSNPPINGSDNGSDLPIFAITLNAPTLPQSSFCQGETFTVNFTQSSCNFVNTPSANIYSVELSNASGSFTSPITIGTLSSITPAVITCTLPSGTPAGAGYRMRISASSPAVTSSDNGSNLTVQAAVGTPTVFGVGKWNVYCYNSRNDYTTNYQGMYTDNNLSFTTTTRWANTLSPSSANSTAGTAYTGCSFGISNYSYSYKRTGIACGYYQIDIPVHRNEVYLIINGTTVFSHTTGGDSHTNVWTGIIDGNDSIEVRCANLNSGQGNLTVNFTKLNQLTMSAPVTVCANTSATLVTTNTSSLSLTYAWTPTISVSPTTGATVVGTPSLTTIYTVTATEPVSGCAVFSNTVTVTVNPVPTTATSISSTVVCSGQSSSQITATGANTYSWSPSAGLSATVGNIVTASPTITTTYSVTGSNNCTTTIATRVVSVQNIPTSPSPTVYGNGVWNVYCYSSSALTTLYGYYTENNLSFVSSSRWATTGSPSSANASSGLSYTGCVISTGNHGTVHRRTNFTCGYYRIDLSHDDNVTLSINGSTVFTSSGTNTNTGAWTGFLGPSSTAEIKHTNSTSNSFITTTFVIVPVPSLSPPVTICAGTSATLTAAQISGLSYSWTPNTSLSTTTGTITVSSTTVSTNYTCTVTDPVSTCSAATSVSVTVNPVPTTSVSPSSATINCSAQIYTLTATGANTYTWSPSAGLSTTSGYSTVASPTANTIYTVTGSNNCVALTATSNITVVPLITNTVFPTNTWNAYCYASTTWTNYYGYYTEDGNGTSGYDFNTTTRWAATGVASSANSTNGLAYKGCTMPATNSSISFRRTGFACNTYSIVVGSNKDNLTIVINGTSVATRAASAFSTTLWTGVLSPSTTVELKMVQTTTTGSLVVTFVPAASTPSISIWSGASSTNWFTTSNWCSSSVPTSTNSVMIYNTGTSFQPSISALGAACANLTISGASASTGTILAIPAATLIVGGAFGLDVYGDWINNGSFTAGTGTVSMLGSGSKTLSCNGTETFYKLALKNDGTITIPTGIHKISNNMDFTSGIVDMNATLHFLTGATATNANDTGYVDGPIVKFGNQAFTFPVGLNGLYRPISISAPASTSDNFTAQYFYSDPSPPYTYSSLDPTIHHISRCEYWILNRTGGSSIVNVTLSWDTTSCGITSLVDLLVARWDAGSSEVEGSWQWRHNRQYKYRCNYQ